MKCNVLLIHIPCSFSLARLNLSPNFNTAKILSVSRQYSFTQIRGIVCVCGCVYVEKPTPLTEVGNQQGDYGTRFGKSFQLRRVENFLKKKNAGSTTGITKLDFEPNLRNIKFKIKFSPFFLSMFAFIAGCTHCPEISTTFLH